jgi:hypothetical protein
MNTNAVPTTGLQIPGLDLLPQSWQGPILIIAVLAPYLTRAYHALAQGGGIRGVMAAIWLGTNTPAEPTTKG